MMEHYRAITSRTGVGSAVAKHHHQLHKGLPAQFTSNVLARERKNLTRLVLEALHMEKNIGHTLMNQKGEYGRLKLKILDQI